MSFLRAVPAEIDGLALGFEIPVSFEPLDVPFVMVSAGEDGGCVRRVQGGHSESEGAEVECWLLGEGEDGGSVHVIGRLDLSR